MPSAPSVHAYASQERELTRGQGLDSQGAIGIVRLLRRLADAGQAIICTIHQANQEQFELVSNTEAALLRGRFAKKDHRVCASLTTYLPSTVVVAFTILERRAQTGRRCWTTSRGMGWLRRLTRT